MTLDMGSKQALTGAWVLQGAAQLPVLTARQEQEQRLEVEELHGRDESTREAAEEKSSSNSAEWVRGL